MKSRIIKVFAHTEELNSFAAAKFVEIAQQSISQAGRFTVALSGGSTPKSLFQLLTTEKFINQIEWSKVFFFFGDERNVAPGDEESNFRMANENLFAPLNIAGENVFRWRTETGEPEKIAADYERTIKLFFDLTENNFPRFDLILLGMGDDGHTASLFPLTEALKEKKKIAVANPVEKLGTTRLTLTFPVINNARNVIFLIAGKNKSEILREVLEGDFQPDNFPSQNVKPVDGNLFWLIEKEAARFLK